MPATARFLIGIAVIGFFGVSCSSHSGKSFVPGLIGYPDNHHKVFVLDDKLLEISGIVHLGNEMVAAINDEQGELFIVNLVNDSSVSYKFKGKGDYEDLAKTDSSYFVLESNGNLIEIMPPSTDHQTYKFEEKNIEFESLVWYKKENKLILISKDQKNKKKGITAYSFDLQTKQFDPEPFFNISYKEVFTKLENYNAECKPSAAAINPVNNKLYIIAAVGKILLECSSKGKIERIYKINPAHFPQPEGITFATNGDMYISNEGADGKATILKFPYSGGI